MLLNRSLRNTIILICLINILIMPVSCKKVTVNREVPETTAISDENWVEESLAAMSLEEKTGQLTAVSFTEDFSDNLYQVLQQGVRDGVAPAVVCAVGKNGKIVFNRAAGKMTYDYDSDPVSTETIFDLASLTKVTATTTLAMIFYSRGAFKLEDPVGKFIPEMKNGGKFTIKHLLTHCSGLPAFIRFFLDYSGKEEILEQIFNTDLTYEPGTKTVYSDIGMMLMATVLERISGTTLDRLAADEIFSPLQMRDTQFNPPKELLFRIAPTEDDPWRGRVVHGEVHDENAFAFGGVSGHAGLFSTTGDLSILCQMLLNRGIYNSKRLIDPEVVKMFTSRQNFIDGSSRALGWDTKSGRSSSGNYFSDMAFGHTGYTGTSIWIDPERDIFVVLLTNRVHPTRNNQKIGQFRRLVHDTVMEMLRK